MKAYILSTAAAVLAVSGAALAADSGFPVDRIKVTGLGLDRSKALSVFYVSSRAVGLGTPGEVPVIRSVKLPPAKAIISSTGEAIVPRATVPRTSPDFFNMAVFVVHSASQNEIYLKNPNGKCPRDPRVPTADTRPACPEGGDELFEHDRIFYRSYDELKALPGAAEGRGSVTVDLSRGGR